MNLFNIINLKACICFVCICRQIKSFWLRYHWVLSEKTQWILTNQSIEIRKHQKGELGPFVPSVNLMSLYIMTPHSLQKFGLQAPQLDSKENFQNCLPTSPSNFSINSSFQQHIVTHWSQYLFWGSPFCAFFFFSHALLFLECHSPPLLLISILHEPTQMLLCH